MPEFTINTAACRGRQRRLIDVMQRGDVPLAVVTQHEHVQWLTGHYIPRTFQSVAALTADGHLTVVVPPKMVDALTGDDGPAADTILSYEAQWHSTLRNDQRQASSEVLIEALRQRGDAKRIGVEFSSFGPHLANALTAEWIDIEPDLYRLRRRKDADELARIKKAIAATGAMYARAREIIEPGINELEVFNQLQATAVREMGEMMTGTGNDYRSGARGGPPGDRTAVDGELYILDLGPAFRGYFADNCRTFAINGNPTDVQQEAHQHLLGVFEMIQRDARPGVRARKIFDQAQTLLDACPLGEFNHHLGHGIGLFPHEAPHLNPRWDDALEVGDAFAAEPGLYSEQLRVGMRLENNYVVTEGGVELLSDFPLEL